MSPRLQAVPDGTSDTSNREIRSKADYVPTPSNRREGLEDSGICSKRDLMEMIMESILPACDGNNASGSVPLTMIANNITPEILEPSKRGTALSVRTMMISNVQSSHSTDVDTSLSAPSPSSFDNGLEHHGVVPASAHDDVNYDVNMVVALDASRTVSSLEDGSAMDGNDSVMALPDYDMEASVMMRQLPQLMMERPPPRRSSSDFEYGRKIHQASGLTWIDDYFDPMGIKEVTSTLSCSATTISFQNESSSFCSNNNSSCSSFASTLTWNDRLVAVFDFDHNTMLWYHVWVKFWTFVAPITMAGLSLIVLFTVPALYSDGNDNLNVIRTTLLTLTVLWSVLVCYGQYRIVRSNVMGRHVAVMSRGICIVHDHHMDARTFLGVTLAAFHIFDKQLMVPIKTIMIPYDEISKVSLQRPGRVNQENDCAYWICFHCLKIPFSTVRLRLVKKDDGSSNSSCSGPQTDPSPSTSREQQRHDSPIETLDGLLLPKKFQTLVRAMIKDAYYHTGVDDPHPMSQYNKGGHHTAVAEASDVESSNMVLDQIMKFGMDPPPLGTTTRGTSGTERINQIHDRRHVEDDRNATS